MISALRVQGLDSVKNGMELLFVNKRREFEADGEGGILGVCFAKNLEKWTQ